MLSFGNAAPPLSRAVIRRLPAAPVVREVIVSLYPPVPLGIQRVAQVERAQVLVESASRTALQQFLTAWQPLLRSARTQHRAVLRWAIDVDPLVI